MLKKTPSSGHCFLTQQSHKKTEKEHEKECTSTEVPIEEPMNIGVWCHEPPTRMINHIEVERTLVGFFLLILCAQKNKRHDGRMNVRRHLGRFTRVNALCFLHTRRLFSVSDPCRMSLSDYRCEMVTRGNISSSRQVLLIIVEKEHFHISLLLAI